MKIKIIIYSILILGMGVWSSCNDNEFLNRKPTNILTENQVWNNQEQVLSVLGDLYNRYVDIASVKNWTSLSDFNDAFWSEAGQYGNFQNSGWDYSAWASWDYNYIRDLNLFIQKCNNSTSLDQSIKERYLAEARYLRAAYYFELVKRMGGVPLILEPLTYDFSGDPSYLRYSRAKESDIYDFILKEAFEINEKLPINVAEKSRATKGAVLAMASRAALYAASIAKYGVTTPVVTLQGGEVGIPNQLAESYYTKSLLLAQEIIQGKAGAYSLYNKKPDLAENFASIFYDKSNNPEIIFVEDFKLQTGKTHGFTVSNQPRFGAEEEEGGRINPSLNMVQSFEKLDNTFAPLVTTKSDGSPMYYTNVDDIFADRDARLAGTIILPGSKFKGRTVDIWAGFELENKSIISGTDRGAQKVLPGKNVAEQVVGFDGPIDGFEFTAQTGFYLRKYLDPATGSGQRGVRSEVWFVRYRFAEVLLNAAEAAFELGKNDLATQYLNMVRVRAGFKKPLLTSEISFDRIVHERKVELAYEGHTLYDLKRWRLAHIVQDGNPISINELHLDIEKATKRNTQPYSLWPYKVYAPQNDNHNKWTFKIIKLSRVTGADRFLLGNYYSKINDDIINNNPKIIRNPNQ